MKTVFKSQLLDTKTVQFDLHFALRASSTILFFQKSQIVARELDPYLVLPLFIDIGILLYVI